MSVLIKVGEFRRTQPVSKNSEIRKRGSKIKRGIK